MSGCICRLGGSVDTWARRDIGGIRGHWVSECQGCIGGWQSVGTQEPEGV